MAYKTQHGPGGLPAWSHKRWLLIATALVVIAVAAFLIVTYTGGGHGSGGGYRY